MEQEEWVNPFGEYGNQVWEDDLDVDDPYYDLMVEDNNEWNEWSEQNEKE